MSQITPPLKNDTKKAEPRFCSYGVEFGDLYLNGCNRSRPPIHDCSGPDRQDGVHEKNWSITDEAAKDLSSGGRVCRSGATQDQMQILVGDRYDKNRWPHINGAHAEPVLTVLSTPELAQTKTNCGKDSVQKSFIFRHALLSPKPFDYHIISTAHMLF